MRDVRGWSEEGINSIVNNEEKRDILKVLSCHCHMHHESMTMLSIVLTMNVCVYVVMLMSDGREREKDNFIHGKRKLLLCKSKITNKDSEIKMCRKKTRNNEYALKRKRLS